jgi:hypothetical protein
MRQIFPGYNRPKRYENEKHCESATFAIDANVLLNLYVN